MELEPWIRELGGLANEPGKLALALGLGTLASEDLTCIAGGILSADGRIAFPLAVGACAAGIWLGDCGLYALGRASAAGLVRWRFAHRLVSPARLEAAREAFARRGLALVFTSRFLPGTRLPCYLAAGVARWPFWRFGTVMAVAVGLWVMALVGLARAVGAVALGWVERWSGLAWVVIPALLALLWGGAHLLPGLATWRGRRLWLGRWRRLTRWEYWPVGMVYPPVVFFLLALAVRHRAWAVWSAANPAIPHGGVSGESKSAILGLLPSDGEVAVARWTLLKATMAREEALDVVNGWLDRGPVVLKPDVGERGEGVAVIRSRDEARDWLERASGDAILQEFVAGEEFGIVWRRRADGGGEIRSIARKVPPELLGDGVMTLGELILADDREMAMAGWHFRRWAGALETVPGNGERVRLGELGTHCRGACFLDERELATRELAGALEAAMAGAAGLDFGRFDLRVPDTGALREGRAIRILEFNGVTGEPAHIYQPGYPWWRGISDLCGHWRAACAVGAVNRRRGARVSSLADLFRTLRQHGRRERFEAPEVTR